jgi:hypothetical protein
MNGNENSDFTDFSPFEHTYYYVENNHKFKEIIDIKNRKVTKEIPRTSKSYNKKTFYRGKCKCKTCQKKFESYYSNNNSNFFWQVLHLHFPL